jgi:transcriptional regulator with XRE-family HTH domain
VVGGADQPSAAEEALFGIGAGRDVSVPGPMPPATSGDGRNFPVEPPYRGRHRPQQVSSLGAGYLVLVARELTGLSQRRLAGRVGTSQPSLAKIGSGSRIPTLRSLLRVAGAAGYEFVLGLIGADEDQPLPDELDAFALLGVLRPDPDDDLADFVVFREPSVFDGPREDATPY